MTPTIRTIHEEGGKEFQEKCQELLSAGYKISSNSCGMLPGGSVGDTLFPDTPFWMAILIKEEK